MATVRPRGTVRSTWSTARKGSVRPGIGYCFTAPVSRSSGSPAVAGDGAPPDVTATLRSASPGAAARSRRVYSCRGREMTSCAGPDSTISPRYMTTTRSARSAARARSWVMSTTAAPTSAASSAIWSRTSRCTVTSSAEVGSSASSTSGRQASAIAMSTRWRIPPENSCGYWSKRASASAMPARVSSATASVRAAGPDARSWTSSASTIWAPTRITGLRPVIGSCGTSPIRLPRTPRRVRSSAAVMSRSRSMTDPDVMRPLSASSRLTDAARVDLPDPDSPTTATVSPTATSRSTPRTASTSPREVENATVRSRIDRTTSAAPGSVMAGLLRPSVLSWRRRA